MQSIESENELKAYMVDVLEGLVYMHDIGVIHADMKLDNILAMTDSDSDLPILKIADLGLALIADEKGEVLLTEKIGTLHYIAPEVAAGNRVTSKIDMWGLGIILYKMCCAYRPNQVKNYNYGDGPIPFRPVDWKQRSPELIDLVSKMLEYDPAKRISSREALDHKWLSVD